MKPECSVLWRVSSIVPDEENVNRQMYVINWICVPVEIEKRARGRHYVNIAFFLAWSFLRCVCILLVVSSFPLRIVILDAFMRSLYMLKMYIWVYVSSRTSLNLNPRRSHISARTDFPQRRRYLAVVKSSPSYCEIHPKTDPKNGPIVRRINSSSCMNYYPSVTCLLGVRLGDIVQSGRSYYV